MIRTKQTHVTGPMNKAEAQAITDRIRGHIDAAWTDITRAYEGKAWKALGYTSWEGYVKAEFDMSRRRSYQLLDQGRVIGAIAEAAGESVQHVAHFSARDVAALKDDLPEVAAEIRERVEQGEKPEDAAKDIAAKRRAEKEKAKAAKAAQQVELDRQRDEFNANLPAFVAEREQAKADAIAARKVAPADTEDQIAELERLNAELNDKVEEQAEAIKALESEVVALRAENKLYGEMKVQFEKGGFEKVIADKDEEIRVLQTRVEAESRDKAIWAGKAKYWQAEAKKLGWTNGDFTIDIETGEIADA